MTRKKVSGAMLHRLPGYLKYLKSLPETASVNISATTLAKAMGYGEVMVRKDLASISSGGRKKVGHIRENLIRDIELFLIQNGNIRAIIVGMGNLGRTLMEYKGFSSNGTEIIAGFDSDPAKVRPDAENPVFHISELESICRTGNARIGIIAVPAEEAQHVCDRLVSIGIEAIWNFAPVTLTAPKSVLVRNENLEISLTMLCLQLNSANAK